MATLVQQLLDEFNSYYETVIQSNIREHPHLSLMLGYHLGWYDAEGHIDSANRGKQLRPLLTLLSCGAKGSDNRRALPLAAAIELLHNFSLIHDDIMDNSDQRRGRTTVWKVWGVNQAINTGDGAYGLSFQLLAEADRIDPQIIVYAQRLFSKACVDTVAGQMLDVSFEAREIVSSEEYTLMTRLKTGPLLGVALGGGALFAGASWAEAQALSEIGHQLGVAFQIQDDILGIWGTPDKTGKSVDDDLVAKKKSLPLIWALENLPEATTSEIRRLYQAEAPLPLEVTHRIREILTMEGVQEAVEFDAKQRYEQVMAGLAEYYLLPSDYREALFDMVAFIVNRTH